MRIVMYHADSRGRWNELCDSAADATDGHLWQWREIIATSYGFTSFYLVAEEPNGSPIAALPLVKIRSRLYGTELASMPYIDYGGICHHDSLTTKERERCDRSLFNYALQLGKAVRAKRLHVRNLELADPRFEVSTEKVTQHLGLATSVQDQFKRLPAERRNRIRRSERMGLTHELHPADDERIFDEFCDIYSANMSDLGSPTHSREFFRQTTSRFRDRISFIVIRHRGAAVAAAIAFEFRGMLSLPWSGATLDARPVYGSNALYWSAISLAIERGCHTFDFGRSSIGSGIFEFKRQWGPAARQTYWSTYYYRAGAKAPRQRRELQMATVLWRRVPLALARAVGPTLRKGISN
jgi:serine/alanine adding enzyme